LRRSVFPRRCSASEPFMFTPENEGKKLWCFSCQLFSACVRVSASALVGTLDSMRKSLLVYVVQPVISAHAHRKVFPNSTVRFLSSTPRWKSDFCYLVSASAVHYVEVRTSHQ